MSIQVKKVHPALKHAGYAATALLPGENPADFEQLHRDLFAELKPKRQLEELATRWKAAINSTRASLRGFRVKAQSRLAELACWMTPSEHSGDYATLNSNHSW